MAADYETAVWSYYRYEPSTAAAIIFIVLFILTTSLHLYQCVRTRTLYFIPFVVGGFFEWIGYVGRAISTTETPNWTMVPYIIQSILLLVAPALFAASIYMLLGRIILLVDGEAHSIVRRTWLTKIFVMGDVLSFLMQSSGGGIMAGGSLTSMQTGEHIIIGGLILQVLFFGFFIVTAGLFHWRINKLPTARSNPPDIPWRKHMRSLYVTSLLILIRSVFRVIEYAAGNDGYLLRHEIFLYIFDALLMFAVMVWFNWYHPSEVQALLKGGKWCEDGVKMRQVSL